MRDVAKNQAQCSHVQSYVFVDTENSYEQIKSNAIYLLSYNQNSAIAFPFSSKLVIDMKIIFHNTAWGEHITLSMVSLRIFKSDSADGLPKSERMIQGTLM